MFGTLAPEVNAAGVAVAQDDPGVQAAADAAAWIARLATAARACCCPARPAVVAVLPARQGRPGPVDLLLCGHHYRASRAALEAAGATVYGSADW